VAIALVAMAPCLVALGRYGRSKVSETSSVVAGAGTCLLAIGCTTSIVNQHDLAIFPAIAALANVAWLLGMMTAAVSLKRGSHQRRDRLRPAHHLDLLDPTRPARRVPALRRLLPRRRARPRHTQARPSPRCPARHGRA